MKFAELVVKAGFPPGVINVLPGKGNVRKAQITLCCVAIGSCAVASSGTLLAPVVAEVTNHSKGGAPHWGVGYFLNILTLLLAGSIVGQGLTDHMDVRKVGFTGSTGVGQTIMKSAALSNVKKVSLELGGKSPLIIFSDCELDKAVRVVSGAWSPSEIRVST